ncbi:Membrane fusion protein of RND family multidrug efflux pump [Rhodopirellula islandica]|uniref:Membrane fusion protein of RND family multidrug efflux pump n=1 Tax=Rhodopirellula islandica TaxID=595434 RepID=A0A0J1B474_RHOIS|nr:efflux RND transporter periplasmic adaptor subunit [Rhodopirellula islandica]KLU01655.1 Membrane fusion protein of RND family multidrug efflux pump [Rhodopirellula islandica]
MNHKWIATLCVLVSVQCLGWLDSGALGTGYVNTVSADEYEAFTEPYRRISVSSSEMGVITELKVREGDEVKEGQLLAQLEDALLRKTLEVSRAAKDAVGGKTAAEAEVGIREQQVQSYRRLFTQGNATPRELERAENDHRQALARLQSVTEELSVRALEHQRVICQLEQRRIQAPADGVVVSFAKEAGEFVSPTDPVLLQLVQLDRLKAIFSVPLRRVDRLSEGQTVVVRVGGARRAVLGTLEHISPVANAESGTVRVRVVLDNESRDLRSGVVCWLDLEASARSIESKRTRVSDAPLSLSPAVR